MIIVKKDWSLYEPIRFPRPNKYYSTDSNYYFIHQFMKQNRSNPQQIHLLELLKLFKFCLTSEIM